jgi:hypothetical protein
MLRQHTIRRWPSQMQYNINTFQVICLELPEAARVRRLYGAVQGTGWGLSLGGWNQHSTFTDFVCGGAMICLASQRLPFEPFT